MLMELEDVERGIEYDYSTQKPGQKKPKHRSPLNNAKKWYAKQGEELKCIRERKVRLTSKEVRYGRNVNRR